MAISGILLSYFSNYAIKRKRYWVYVQRSYYICRVLCYFKVNCKGKFLITYIFHDVFFLKSLYEVSQLSFSINSVGLKVVCSSIVCFGELCCLFFCLFSLHLNLIHIVFNQNIIISLTVFFLRNKIELCRVRFLIIKRLTDLFFERLIWNSNVQSTLKYIFTNVKDRVHVYGQYVSYRFIFI